MLMMFALMLVGFILKKKNILPDNSGTVMSRLETYVFSPALAFVTQIANCTVENFNKYSVFMLYSLLLGLLAIGVAYPLSYLFIRRAKGDSEKEALQKIYRYAMTFGNFGFMGNFLVLGVWGSEMLFKYTMFTFPISVLCYGWGIPLLIPKDGRGIKATLKSIFNPPMLGMVSGAILGLLGVGKYMPDFFSKALDSAADCMGPVAMILAGFVIGGFEMKALINDKKVYVATFLRLIVIPTAITLLMKLVGAPLECTLFALICFATPLGLNTVVYPAAFGTDTKPGASMAMISHTLSVITIPLMYLIFIA